MPTTALRRLTLTLMAGLTALSGPNLAQARPALDGAATPQACERLGFTLDGDERRDHRAYSPMVGMAAPPPPRPV